MPSKPWTSRPIMAGLVQESAEFGLREAPGAGWPAVTTRATASVAPDFDWRTNGVLWGVTFHRYAPLHPLETRLKRNPTTGAMQEIPPPPGIPERKIGGRVAVEGDALQAAMKEARERCEETVKAGRPSG